MSYIDGFVLPIRKDRIEDYRRIAHTAGGIWREHGALDYHECIAEDLRTDGGLRSYVDLLQLGPDETVVFAWIEFPSRADRDRINAAVMADERLSNLCQPGDPVDYRRMAYGGFETLVRR